MPTPQKTISLHSTQVKSDGIIISSRWNPTREQILALEEIYRGGTTTPTPYQIQKIVSMLRCFGRIEGKNVFYWFQNHKARERHKWRRQQAGYHLSLAKKRIPVSEEKKSTLAGKREIGEQHRLQLQQMNNNRISRADCVGIHDGEERESKTLQLFPCHRGYRHDNAYCGVNVKTTAVKDYAALADDQAQIASTINASFVRTPTEFYEFLPMKS